AARAATTALRRAPGLDAGEIDLMLHATVYYQGHDLWAAPSYVQRVAVGNRCPAIEVRQMSNGGMAALELAAGYLAAAPGRCAALVTAADTFRLPGFDRWRSDPGTLYADGGVALILSRRNGFARLRSLVSVSDPELEGMHRGDDPFGAAPFSVRAPMDLDVWKRAFVARHGRSFGIARVAAGEQEVLKLALAEADTELGQVDWFLLPHFGRKRLEVGLVRHLGIELDRTTWSWHRDVGHLGAGDQIAGLDHLAASGALRPGQRCLLFGVGAGFTWSCGVLEIERTPAWPG
ncbi:MAG TPA: ketoacyl-ACP synthase III family protein, partial [Pseudonocardiaceae bacterium]|nr:ketoacyl-ACP synthase III family protein [Pseudonocardiaceae bacterium]